MDEQNLTANPKVAIVYDIEPDEHGKPSNRPVTIRWFTQRDAPLSIVFKQDTCVDKLTCDGRGACTASTKRLASGEKSRKCTYNMFANHVKDDDSDIVLNPCCL